MPIGRQIQVGGTTKAELLGRLQRAGIELNAAAQILFADQRFQALPEATTLQCIETDAAELGLVGGGTFADVVAAAAVKGWSVCPLELGPQLRLSLLDQPEGAVGVPETRHRAPPGSITVASAPLDDEDETPKGFYLRRIDGTLWLRGYRSWPGHVWDPGDRFIFGLQPGR
jgi:hypothetical protein